MPRGGYRPGSGRKKKALIITRKNIAEAALSTIDEHALWVDLLRCDDLRLRFDVARYLRDRVSGKAAQAVLLSGPNGEPLDRPHDGPTMSVVFVSPRYKQLEDGTLAERSAEELKLIDLSPMPLIAHSAALPTSPQTMHRKLERS